MILNKGLLSLCLVKRKTKGKQKKNMFFKVNLRKENQSHASARKIIAGNWRTQFQCHHNLLFILMDEAERK